MALLDIFKKKKVIKKKQEKTVKKPVKKSKEVKTKKPVEVLVPEAKKQIKIGEAYKILKSPQVTEKASFLAEKNQYVFKVYPRANKIEVKKAIENVFGVNVVSVKIINVPAKKRRIGRTIGERPGYKKAIVRIKTGQKIEVLPR